MKTTAFAILMISILLQACTHTFDGVKIVGKVKNSDQEYVYLAHQPLYRGNLNFDGFKSIGDRIDDKGNFTLISDKSIDAADYWIQVKDKAFHLVLFRGDDIKLEFDLKDIDSSLFVQGRGAGKINVLRLAQFANPEFDTKYTMDAYKLYIDSVIAYQLLFLDLIYDKDLENELLQTAKNKRAIIKIIKDTPLSEKEYEFLKKKISMQDIYFLGRFLFYQSQEETDDTSKIDFSSSYFACFNPAAYKEIENVNYWQFEDCVNMILGIEYLKSIQQKDRQLTCKNFGIDDYSKYRDWSFSYAKNNLDPNVFDAYFASQLASDLSTGDFDKNRYDRFVKNCTGEKYVNGINHFVGLLDSGLHHNGYKLDAGKYTLNSLKLDSLLKSKRGKNVYVLIWSARFAGATLISELPSIIDFEKENSGEIGTLHICIDKEKHKNLWAARIIDNSWKADHYFLPAENNDSIINLFAAQNISGFCDGGATYSFIDGNGNITNNIEAPIAMTKEKLDHYKGNAVR